METLDLGSQPHHALSQRMQWSMARFASEYLFRSNMSVNSTKLHLKPDLWYNILMVGYIIATE